MLLHSDATPKPADESARLGQPVEWWVVQGRFAGDTVPGREFMVSLFRHALEWRGLSMGNACTLISSSLDCATGRNQIVSVVERGTIPFLVTAAERYPPPGLDPHVLRTLAQELAEYGPPSSVRVEAGRAEFSREPFQVQWGGFHLAQGCDAFILRFVEPGTGRSCCFRLGPKHPRFHLSNVEVPDAGRIDHVAYTRLLLEGDVDEQPVTGEAWLDHQWGSQGWVVGREKDRTLGWNWLRVQLDDERELLVTAHCEMRSRTELATYAVLVDANGSASLHNDVVLSAACWWASPVTRACYPLRWHLSVPSLRIDLDFEPLADDQEIPLLPPLRAVWEGAGRVFGTCGTHEVTGRARLQLHGYAYITDFSQYLEGLTQRVQRHLESFLQREPRAEDVARLTGNPNARFDLDAQTAMLSAPLWDLMDRAAGRLWYALPGLFMLEALGVGAGPYERLACVVAEMLHAGAEIIDDIQDKAQVRRGGEAIHLRYGLDVALSAGSTAWFLPFSLLADYPGLNDGQRLELFRILSRMAIKTHLGQAQDLHYTRVLTPKRLREWANDSLEQRVVEIYEAKTAAFTAAACDGAAVIANADAPTRAACVAFGRTLGLALQIVNDIANFSTERQTRGHGGRDLAEGKVTLVIARALQSLSTRDSERLAEIFSAPELRQSSPSLNEGIELIRRSGALKSCEADARRMLEKEWRNLSKVLPPSEPKTMLRVLWSFVVDLGDELRYPELVPA